MKKSLIFCLLVCSINLFPQSRDAEQAREIAATFFYTAPEGKLLAPAYETLELVYTQQNERVDAPVKNLFTFSTKKTEKDL